MLEGLKHFKRFLFIFVINLFIARTLIKLWRALNSAGILSNETLIPSMFLIIAIILIIIILMLMHFDYEKFISFIINIIKVLTNNHP